MAHWYEFPVMNWARGLHYIDANGMDAGIALYQTQDGEWICRERWKIGARSIPLDAETEDEAKAAAIAIWRML